MNRKRSTVPVFLIYAGIIHAIGLALLMPMLITLPGPGKEALPKSAAIDVEIIPAAPAAAKLEQDDEQTSALPSAEPSPQEDRPVESGPEPSGTAENSKPGAESPVANVSPEAEPLPGDDQTPAQEEAATKTKSEVAKPAKAAPATVKKPTAQRYRAVRRTASAKAKPIRPFNGALSGLFTPGAPVRRR